MGNETDLLFISSTDGSFSTGATLVQEKARQDSKDNCRRARFLEVQICDFHDVVGVVSGHSCRHASAVDLLRTKMDQVSRSHAEEQGHKFEDVQKQGGEASIVELLTAKMNEALHTVAERQEGKIDILEQQQSDILKALHALQKQEDAAPKVQILSSDRHESFASHMEKMLPDRAADTSGFELCSAPKRQVMTQMGSHSNAKLSTAGGCDKAKEIPVFQPSSSLMIVEEICTCCGMC